MKVTSKVMILSIGVIFSVIGVLGWMRQKPSKKAENKPAIQEIVLQKPKPVIEAPLPAPKPVVKEVKPTPVTVTVAPEDLPFADRIQRLFALDSSKLPFVETVSYTSRVPWLEGRPAWVADYATHYETSRHFIARSLNRKVDYLSQKVSLGDRFNVFRRDKPIEFYLLVDLSRCRMWFYLWDKQANERVLLKTYSVGLGRPEPHRASGSLTPLGKYSLGEKVAIYKPGTQGFFQDKKVEMIQVFGTRWIPFEKEIEGCTEPAKALGLHGIPWVSDANGTLVEDISKMGKYDSDGCIRLLQADIEEIFAIVITKPTTLEIIKDFRQAKLPGVEKQL